MATVIKCNNQNSIKLTNNIVYHERSKHIDTQYHFLKEKIQSKEVTLIYCNISENVAGIFTKPLGKEKYESFILF